MDPTWQPACLVACCLASARPSLLRLITALDAVETGDSQPLSFANRDDSAGLALEFRGLWRRSTVWCETIKRASKASWT